MLQVLFALLAGILTIAAPCILPLLPVLLGTSVGHRSKTRPVFIVLGFIIVFSLAGLLLATLSTKLGLNPNTLRLVAIVVLALFGALLLWPLPFELIAGRLSGTFAKVGAEANQGQGNLSGFVLGMTLGLVWTPCAGPVLGTVLTLVALQRELTTAGILLTAYAIGAALPMLAIAYGGQYLTAKVRVLTRYTGVLQRTFGVLIITLAVALYYNYDTKLYAVLLEHYPTFNPKL